MTQNQKQKKKNPKTNKVARLSGEISLVVVVVVLEKYKFLFFSSV